MTYRDKYFSEHVGATVYDMLATCPWECGYEVQKGVCFEFTTCIYCWNRPIEDEPDPVAGQA